MLGFVSAAGDISTPTAVPVLDGVSIVQVAAATSTAYALACFTFSALSHSKANGTLYAWGTNYNGEFCNAVALDDPSPRRVSDGIVSIASTDSGVVYLTGLAAFVEK
jgi:alpha-tubulin suppressor-like RCC1 family protein